MSGSRSIPFSSSERREAAEGGFTLLEVLVAVAVTALLLTTVYGVFGPVAAARDRLEGESLAYHEARVLLDRMGREVRGAYYSKQTGSNTRFEGRGDDGPYLLLSTTAATPQAGGSGVALVRYELGADPEGEDERKGDVLLRGEAPLWAENAEKSPAYRLGSGIAGLGLRFYDGREWLKQWPPDGNRRGLPQQVEVTLTMRVNDGEVPFVTSFEVPNIQAGQ